MRAPGKIGVVVAGYLLAGAVACAAVAMNDMTQPGRDSSGGMSAFGDTLLFLGVFTLAAIPASSAGLYFLRGQSWFWSGLAVVGPAVAVTSIAASIIFLGASGAGGDAVIRTWSLFSLLRIIAAPICAVLFLLAGILAPKRPWRLALLSAATIEASAFGAVVLGLLLRSV